MKYEVMCETSGLIYFPSISSQPSVLSLNSFLSLRSRYRILIGAQVPRNFSMHVSGLPRPVSRLDLILTLLKSTPPKKKGGGIPQHAIPNCLPLHLPSFLASGPPLCSHQAVPGFHCKIFLGSACSIDFLLFRFPVPLSERSTSCINDVGKVDVRRVRPPLTKRRLTLDE